METYYGYIESVQDALLVFEACRLGYLNRVQRRLSDKERRSIRSGSVYIWEEEESGIRRWTDGYTWSPSRVFGSFLTYRELKARQKVKIPSPTLSNSDSESEDRGRSNQSDILIKENGLVKQSMSVTTTNGRKFHLISYYNKDHVASGLLKVPSFDSSLAHIKIPKGLYPDIAPDLFRTNELTNPFKAHKPVPITSFVSATTVNSFTYPSPQQEIDPKFADSSNRIRHLEFKQPPSMIQLPPLQLSHSIPMVLPLQDIRLDRLPCSEDYRQLRALTRALSL